MSRLIEGRIQDGATGGGTQKWQSYTYDPFGNIQSIGGTSGRSTPTSSSTNRLTGATVYDSAGNLTNWNANAYEYDRFNQMTRMVSGAEDWRYVYTAGDERFWSYRVGGGGSLWALRDQDGRLLREYEAHTSWSTFKDYIYRGTQLLASSHSAEGSRHFHLDHLGTPRLVTSAGTGGDFYTLTPCRVLDTRNPSAPLSAGETRSVPMAGSCGIPSNAAAVAVNITVVDATSNGEMTAYPANETRPLASAISYQATLTRANNGILKLGNGALAFYNNQPSGSAHLIIDVNGYFTEDAGAVVAYHAYYPFGEEATAFNQDAEQMKFTGHERDLASAAGAGDDLDYMHARHCSPLTGRFLSVDPVLGKPAMPQSWNRYASVVGNPMKFVDRDGRSIWTTIWKVVRHAPDGTRRVIVRFQGTSKRQVVERTKKALDTIDNRQRSQGVQRVVRAETDEARDAMGKQLSTNKKYRGPEKSGAPDDSTYPKHVNPAEGSYKDVHVESDASLLSAGAVVAIGEVVAPATSAVIESEEASPGELLSAAAWDLVGTLDPTGLSDAISWYFDID